MPYSLSIPELLEEQLTGRDNSTAFRAAQALLEISRQSDACAGFLPLFTELLDSPSALARSRGLMLTAANYRYAPPDRQAALLSCYLRHIDDPKPIAARQCIAHLPLIFENCPDAVPAIRAALETADLSARPDSMAPLLKKDIQKTLAMLPAVSVSAPRADAACRYPWLEDYLSAMPGAVRDYKEEWQWHRWQVGGKMFAALCTPGSRHAAAYAGHPLLTLKCEPETALFLRQQHPEILPGFYMDKRCWNSLLLDGGLSEALVRELCDCSYGLVFQKLTKKLQKELLQL